MLNTFFKMSVWMRLELILGFLMLMTASMLGSILIKLEGLYLTLTTITILMFIKDMRGMGSVFIKDIPTYRKYIWLIIFEILLVIVLNCYSNIDMEIFLYLISINSLLLMVLLNGFYMDYDTILKDLITSSLFRDIQYLEMFVLSLGAVIGNFVMLLLSTKYTYIIIIDIIVIIKIVGIIIYLYLYLWFYKGLEVTLDKNELNSEGQEDKVIICSLEEYKKKNK